MKYKILIDLRSNSWKDTIKVLAEGGSLA